jgi:hypothetical protein
MGREFHSSATAYIYLLMDIQVMLIQTFVAPLLNFRTLILLQRYVILRPLVIPLCVLLHVDLIQYHFQSRQYRTRNMLSLKAVVHC